MIGHGKAGQVSPNLLPKLVFIPPDRGCLIELLYRTLHNTVSNKSYNAWFSAMPVLMNHKSVLHPGIPTLSASGAIAGVLAAYLLVFSLAHVGDFLSALILTLIPRFGRKL